MSNNFEVRDLRKQDWLWTSKAALFHETVNGNDFKVYCGIASYADNKSQKAFPSIDTLATALHMGRSTVIRSLARLEEEQFILVERKTGLHNIYYLLDIPDSPAAKRKTRKTAEEEPAENWVKTMLIWAEGRKGAKFVNYGKQSGALGMMKKSEYTPREICECYLMMEKSEYWKGRGFDFTDVGNELPKKINQIRKTNGTPTFDHLVEREA